MEWMHMLKVYYIRVYTTMKGLIEGLERLPNMRTALSSTSCTGGGVGGERGILAPPGPTDFTPAT